MTNTAYAKRNITHRNRPQIVAAITAVINERSITCLALLQELRKDYPAMSANTLHQILRGLQNNEVINTSGKGHSKLIYKHVDRKAPERPPPKQHWFTPLFVSLTPL